MRLKSLVRSVVEKSDGQAYPYVGLEAVRSGAGQLINDHLPVKSDAASLRHEIGDVLFGKLRPYLEKSFLADAAATGTGELLVLRSFGEIDQRFLLYSTLSLPWIDWAKMTSYGTKMPRTSWEAMGEYKMWVPSLDEQRRIADFLDVETHRVNEMQELISGQMSRISERRAAVLDSLRVDVAEVPMVRLGYKVSLVTSGSRGWASFIGDVGNIFFRSANLSSGSLVPNLENVVFVDIPDLESAELARSLIASGDVLVGITGANAGWVSLADESVSGGNVSQHVCLVRPRVGEVDGRWLAYLISSPVVQGFLMGSQYGGTKTQLSLPDIRNIRIPSMGVGGQRRAADRVEEEVLEGEFQLKLRKQQIELLEERKRALITAAVTGQIDVTTARGADVS